MCFYGLFWGDKWHCWWSQSRFPQVDPTAEPSRDRLRMDDAMHLGGVFKTGDCHHPRVSHFLVPSGYVKIAIENGHL